MAIHIATLFAAVSAPAGGGGYIAGESPNGLVLLAGSPVARPVIALHRNSGKVVGHTVSDPSDGTYRIDGLNPNEEFDIICRDTTNTERDQIKGRVKPKPY